MSQFVIGTAGHIDHGKTSLVKNLTGIDTDILIEYPVLCKSMLKKGCFIIM